MTFKNFTELLFYKTCANLKAEVSRLYLNYAWWALEPLFSMTVFYVIFGIFMNSRTEHFALFLLIGTTQWQWFASTILNASTSIINAKHIMQRVSIPKVFFPLEVFLQSSFKHLFVLALLTIFLIFYPIEATFTWLTLPIVFIVHGLLVVTCAVFFATLVPFVPDLSLVLSTGLNIIFFASGIFFNIDMFVLPEHRAYIYLNPMAGIIREYRRIIIDGNYPDFIYLFNVVMGVGVLAVITFLILKRYDREYPRICQQ